jgi:oligogalacturonide lyase
MPRAVLVFACAILSSAFAAAASTSSPPPTDWIDPDTGHRIIQLSTEPGSTTLYFHVNAYSPEGDKFIFNAPGGIALVDLTTLGRERPAPVIVAAGGHDAAMAQRKREIYFRRGKSVADVPAPTPSTGRRGEPDGTATGEIFAYDIDRGQSHRVPGATTTIINCDATLAVSTVAATDPTGRTPPPPVPTAVSQLARMFPGKTPADLTPEQRAAVEAEEALAPAALHAASHALRFTRLATGAQTTLGYQYANLNDLQFSPTDPNLLLYAHEGPWHEVDRMWTIRADGGEPTLRHPRAADMEAIGHEFWSHDGRTIWYDLQTPRSQHVWLEGLNLDTGKATRFHLRLNWWSVHYNVSRDGTLFCGDGGDPAQVAFGKDGKWINLFRVQANGTTLDRELLVKMAAHNYLTDQGGVEPNSSITPDNRWVIFTGNMFGPRHVYAVEIAKAK